ncbi:proline iminopeptidase [Mollisia scopiformis]|uniref:Proline iminopeptidase n=1 Tax=Mollisia scopiformis TaxID=149040 RepID=A0A194X096_MOLSC|nr:proline iminopeptidase [Mollisia scopiformis]KUJ13379.1 proline iminopeptidase [Mollisia scopiformis]
MAGIQTSTVQMDDGVHLHVKLMGNDEKRPKPLLIAVHAAPGLVTLAEPEAAFAFLSDNFRVLVFDGRGSGESDITGSYTHDRWIRDIDNLRRWAGAEKFVLAGHSYGGTICLDYAVRHGDRLSGLILRNTWTHGIQLMMTALAAVLTDPRLKVDVARQLRVWTGALRDDRDYEEAMPEILPIYSPPGDSSSQMLQFAAYHSATQNFAFNHNMPRFDVRHQLKDIKVPTLVIVGRHDLITPVVFSEEIARSIPDSSLAIFEHSGHNPAGDESQKFQKTVLEFLTTSVL